MDHQPSLAAQIKNREDKLGTKLNKLQIKSLKKNSPAVAAPRKIHQQTSPTYGGRNTPNQIAADAKDLNVAQKRDRSIFDEAMKSRGD